MPSLMKAAQAHSSFTIRQLNCFEHWPLNITIEEISTCQLICKCL